MKVLAEYIWDFWDLIEVSISDFIFVIKWMNKVLNISIFHNTEDREGPTNVRIKILRGKRRQRESKNSQ